MDFSFWIFCFATTEIICEPFYFSLFFPSSEISCISKGDFFFAGLQLSAFG